MKRFVRLQVVMLLVITSGYCWASGGDRDGKGHSDRCHRHYRENRLPPRRDYGVQARSFQRDTRSHQGLAGGVVGSVLGYELGNGSPLATGIGAAAGSFIGNGLSGRR